MYTSEHCHLQKFYNAIISLIKDDDTENEARGQRNSPNVGDQPVKGHQESGLLQVT